jgi:hypothetical protein
MRSLTLFAALLSTACGSDFAPYNEVASLRVLAIRATPAWPAPGETATLDALVVSPGGAAVTYAWSWCPLIGPAAAGAPCLVDEATLRATLDQSLPGSGATLPSYDRGALEIASLPNTVSPPLLRGICTSLKAHSAAASDVACDDTFPVTIELTIRTSTEEVRATKTMRLRYDATSATNDNPAVLGLALGGPDGAVPVDSNGTASVPVETDTELRLDVPESSAETFTAMDGRSSRERLLMTWFVDSGATDKERTTFIDGEVSLDLATRNTWTTPAAKDVGENPASLWVVVHDSRGGVSWTSGTVTLEVSP